VDSPPWPDNLYNDHFFANTLSRVANGTDMVATHWISHYHFNGRFIAHNKLHRGGCGPFRVGRRGEMRAAFQPYCIDLGAVVFRTDLLRQTKARFLIDDLRTANFRFAGAHALEGLKKDLFIRDGMFFQRLADFPGVQSAVVAEVLMIHQ
jgi:hypothetical protein